MGLRKTPGLSTPPISPPLHGDAEQTVTGCPEHPGEQPGGDGELRAAQGSNSLCSSEEKMSWLPGTRSHACSFLNPRADRMIGQPRPTPKALPHIPDTTSGGKWLGTPGTTRPANITLPSQGLPALSLSFCTKEAVST